MREALVGGPKDEHIHTCTAVIIADMIPVTAVGIRSVSSNGG